MARKDEDYGPGMGGVVLSGLITLLIGMVLGGFSLVTQKVDVLSNEPDPDSLIPGKLVYVKGTRSGRTSWRGKEQAWKAGELSTLILTEAELNQWSDSRLKMKKPVSAEDDGGWLSMFDLEVSPVNFRIIEDKLQMAAEVQLPGLLPGSTYIYQVKGQFQASPEGLEFIPESGSFGQAPIGAVPVAGDMVFSLLGKQYEGAEDISWLLDAFGNLESAEIADGQLILRRRTNG